MIVGLLGTPSRDSVTRLGFEVVARRLMLLDIPFDVIDLRDEYLQQQDIDAWEDPPAGTQTAALRRRVSGAAGVILGSSVFHGTFSGRLKNALDQLPGDGFCDMPVGLMAAGGGPRSASVACDHLRSVVRAMSGWSVPSHVGLYADDFVDGKPAAHVVERVDEMLAEMTRFAVARTPAAQPVRVTAAPEGS